MPDSPPPLTPPSQVPDAPRRVIAGRYEVLAVIGRGSSAGTLLCADLREDRRVVVKELHFAHLSDWKHLELFEREATMLGRLDHPSIPKVFDYFQGEGESATFYIVQEYIEATSLQQRMESGPMLAQQEVHDVALGLLDVLAYLHGRAPPVIHRDIKPSNVLLRADGTPALIDFGGVRAAWQPQGAGSTVVGTFGYMAPEQFAGHAGPTSDLYGLGATLLHLVTGHPPSDFPFDDGRIQIPADLPAGRPLAGLIEALLRPSPRDRPASAQTARDLLSNPPPHQAVRRMTRPSPLVEPPAVAPPRTLFGESGEPRYVQMGHPPRDPKGEFRDVYRNLMHPLYPARRPWSDSEQVLWLGITGAACAMTLGVAPALYARQLRKRRRKYGDLFRQGLAATGTILSIPGTDGMSMYTMVKYEFEVGGMTYRGYMQVPAEMSRYWSMSESVAILYDPEDPNQSCIVYR